MPIIKQPAEDNTPVWLRYPGAMVRCRLEIRNPITAAVMVRAGTIGVFLGNRPTPFRKTVVSRKTGKAMQQDTKKLLGSPAFFFDGKAVIIPLDKVYHLEYIPTEGDGVPRK